MARRPRRAEQPRTRRQVRLIPARSAPARGEPALDASAATTGVRSGLLASPVFALSVLTLLVNDHVLKPLWPGLVTGKLSDVAGVAMVAISLTALLRHAGVAFGLTAVAFVLLKTLPPVAVWAAPVLGGVTRTDPVDLVALLVLAPLWRRVHRVSSRRPGASAWQLPLRIVTVAAAVFATTATSTDGEDSSSGYGSFAASGSEAFVWVDGSDIFRSRDGGLTWRRVRARSVPARHELAGGAIEACSDDVCWSVGENELLRTDGGAAPVAVPLPDGGGSRPWSRLVTVTDDDRTSLIAWLPPSGVVRIGPDEEISWHPVEAFDRSVAINWLSVASMIVMFAGPLAMLASAPAARRTAQRRRLRPGGVQGLVVVSAVGLLGLTLFGVLVAAPVLGPEVLPFFAVPIGLTAVGVIGWSWSAAGGNPSLSPSAQPGPFSRSMGGSELPPPDRNNRVG